LLPKTGKSIFTGRDARVSAVVVTYKVNDYLWPCISSLLAQSHAPFEIIIVDNSLDTGSQKKISSVFPSAKILTSTHNLYYAASLNSGISESKGDFILCLNDDVTLDKFFFENALNGFVGAEDIGMVSGKVLRFDAKTIDSAGLYLSLSRTAKERGYGSKDLGQFEKPGFIFGVSGAVALYRINMLKQLQQNSDYFDPDLLFFYEDLDISWRAQNSGWKCYYVPAAVAYHARGGSARRREGIGKSFARTYISDELQFELVKNRWLAIIKNESVLGFFLHLPFILAYDIAEFVFLLVFRPKVIPKLASLPKYLKSTFRKRLAARVVRGLHDTSV
jgi:GT2 family glycosyltransferase